MIFQKKQKNEAEKKPQVGGLFSIVRDYKWFIAILSALGVVYGGLNLLIPMIISHAIDSYTHGAFVFTSVVLQFVAVAIGIFIFRYGQSIFRSYVGEKVAFDLRRKLSEKISRQPYNFIEATGEGKLLTNLTSDAGVIKNFVGMVISSIVRALVLIVGTSILLLMIDWKLALAVLVIIPIIGGTFFFVFSRMRVLFKRGREIIDWLNTVIGENIHGAALVRVLHSSRDETEKFAGASGAAQDNGIAVVRLFSILTPVISLVASLATVVVLLLGGHFVIEGSLTIGEFAAFNGYIAILVFPIIMLGFMSNIIAQADVAFTRIGAVLNEPEKESQGTETAERFEGRIAVKNLSLALDGRPILENVSFEIEPHTKVAIIGPTAAGKSQLLHLLVGLTRPDSGEIYYDGTPLEDYDSGWIHEQMGFVFQESAIFNLSLRENIAFNENVSKAAMEKAITAAEIKDFTKGLPEGLDTLASERGLNLSGGQKQRLMLARALALEPKILLLDDFTARVDRQTEQKILHNIETMYPDVTLISVTQTIAPIRDYEKIIFLMEGEKIAEGTHDELLEHSPEYAQLFKSQQSTTHV